MSPMQEQDFLLVAETLKDERLILGTVAVNHVAIALAHTFESAYYNRFDRTKFLQDAGVEL